MSSCCQTSNACNDAVKLLQKIACKVALVGNPNCGKTTLFNGLTGARQRVGNWPGVTVERKSGYFTEGASTIEVIDLPGVYSLLAASETAAIDERIACEFILEQHADVIVNIVDASNLDRHLYLTTQLLEADVPIILALNMMDVARARGIQIDLTVLSRELGCPVIPLEANKGAGIRELKRVITTYQQQSNARKLLLYPEAITQATVALATSITALKPEWLAMRLLEGDAYAKRLVDVELLSKVAAQQVTIQQTCQEEADILIADARYRFIQQLISQCISRATHIKKTWTSCIDAIVLNRLFGLPLFLGIMYSLFFFSINIGGAFQDFFDISGQTIFVDGFAYVLTNLGVPSWLTALLANGIGKGINTTMTFIPVIGALFLFLAFLEDSGYMVRAAFMIDRFMRALGLPGKAFVPMIVGFGCNVPAVMAARNLENQRDRILTIMMSPFMSCGARLAIYTVFTAAFFPQGGQNVVFMLYLIGIFMAIFTGFILRQTLLKGDVSPLVVEFPPYHLPNIKTILLHTWQRLKGFVFRAGRLIIPICVLIGALNTLNIDGSMNTGDGDAHSLLSVLGQWVTPIFTPMGLHIDNWPATVGLVTGILAKEVVVGTLNTLYTQMGHFTAGSIESFQFWGGLQAAWHSIGDNLLQLSQAFSNPVLAKAPVSSLNEGVYGLMYQKFDGQRGAFAYLLFILLYFPCVSTLAVTLRELHYGWSIFSALWMTGVAYGAAVLFYQAATWGLHPLASSLWIIAIVMCFWGTIIMIRQFSDKNKTILFAGESA